MPSHPIPSEPDYEVHKIGTPTGTRLTVFNNGEVEVSGVDYSSKLTVWSIDHRYIVVKRSGGSHWSGRGQQSYHSPEFMVFQINNGPSDAGRYGVDYGVTSIVDFEVGRDTVPVGPVLERIEKTKAYQAERAQVRQAATS